MESEVCSSKVGQVSICDTLHAPAASVPTLVLSFDFCIFLLCLCPGTLRYPVDLVQLQELEEGKGGGMYADDTEINEQDDFDEDDFMVPPVFASVACATLPWTLNSG